MSDDVLRRQTGSEDGATESNGGTGEPVRGSAAEDAASDSPDPDTDPKPKDDASSG